MYLLGPGLQGALQALDNQGLVCHAKGPTTMPEKGLSAEATQEACVGIDCQFRWSELSGDCYPLQEAFCPVFCCYFVFMFVL